MFNWIPEVAKELRLEIVNIYWESIAIVTLLVVIFEFFNVSNRKLNPISVIHRVFISVLLLVSFEEMINLISMVTDGVVAKLGGVNHLQELLKNLESTFQGESPGLFKFKKMFLYGLNIICYLIALLGFYVTDVLIHFVYTVLYVLSPLLIMAYVPRSTAHITSNLYKGLMHVSFWKILWSLLSVLLLKLATLPAGIGWDGFFMQAILNLCIGISMLLIPFFASSLLSDGLSGMASGFASSNVSPLGASLTSLPRVATGKTGKEILTGFKGSRGLAKRGVNRYQKAKRYVQKRKVQRSIKNRKS